MQVVVDGDKIYDKKEEGQPDPSPKPVKELEAVVKDKLSTAVAGGD